MTEEEKAQERGMAEVCVCGCGGGGEENITHPPPKVFSPD